MAEEADTETTGVLAGETAGAAESLDLATTSQTKRAKLPGRPMHSVWMRN
jgi:hypothetical protein